MGNRRFVYVGDYLGAGGEIHLRCRAWGHYGVMQMDEMMDRAAGIVVAMSFAKPLLRKLRCSKCGGKDLDVYPRSRD